MKRVISIGFICMLTSLLYGSDNELGTLLKNTIEKGSDAQQLTEYLQLNTVNFLDNSVDGNMKIYQYLDPQTQSHPDRVMEVVSLGIEYNALNLKDLLEYYIEGYISYEFLEACTGCRGGFRFVKQLREQECQDMLARYAQGTGETKRRADWALSLDAAARHRDDWLQPGAQDEESEFVSLLLDCAYTGMRCAELDQYLAKAREHDPQRLFDINRIPYLKDKSLGDMWKKLSDTEYPHKSEVLAKLDPYTERELRRRFDEALSNGQIDDFKDYYVKGSFDADVIMLPDRGRTMGYHIDMLRATASNEFVEKMYEFLKDKRSATELRRLLNEARVQNIESYGRLKTYWSQHDFLRAHLLYDPEKGSTTMARTLETASNDVSSALYGFRQFGYSPKIPVLDRFLVDFIQGVERKDYVLDDLADWYGLFGPIDISTISLSAEDLDGKTLAHYIDHLGRLDFSQILERPSLYSLRLLFDNALTMDSAFDLFKAHYDKGFFDVDTIELDPKAFAPKTIGAVIDEKLRTSRDQNVAKLYDCVAQNRSTHKTLRTLLDTALADQSEESYRACKKHYENGYFNVDRISYKPDEGTLGDRLYDYKDTPNGRKLLACVWDNRSKKEYKAIPPEDILRSLITDVRQGTLQPDELSSWYTEFGPFDLDALPVHPSRPDDEKLGPYIDKLGIKALSESVRRHYEEPSDSQESSGSISRFITPKTVFLGVAAGIGYYWYRKHALAARKDAASAGQTVSQ